MFFLSSNYPENTWRRNLRDTNNDTGADNSATSYERTNGARLGYTTGYGGGGLQVRMAENFILYVQQ
jgi:hypothetical protein